SRRPTAARGHLSRQELPAGLHAVPEALLSAARRPGVAAALGIQPSVARVADGPGLLRRASGGRRARRHRLPPGPAVASVELARGEAERRRLRALRLPRHGRLPATRLAPRPHRASHETRQGAAELLHSLSRALSFVRRKDPRAAGSIEQIVDALGVASAGALLRSRDQPLDPRDVLPPRRFRRSVRARQLRTARMGGRAGGGPHVPRPELDLLPELPGVPDELAGILRGRAGDAFDHRAPAVRVIRRCTESECLAVFGAFLFALSGANAGTLGWYAVYGHVLATMFTLLAFLVLIPRAGHVRPPTLAATVGVAGCMLAASQCFGTGTAVALALPVLAVVVRPSCSARRAC